MHSYYYNIIFESQSSGAVVCILYVVSKQYIPRRPTLLCMQGDDDDVDGRLVPKIQKFDYVRSTVIESKYVIVAHKTTLLTKV